MDAADKHFPAPLNKLYAESFYEIGWLQRPPGESHPRSRLRPPRSALRGLKADAKANFEKAERAFQQRDFDACFKVARSRGSGCA